MISIVALAFLLQVQRQILVLHDGKPVAGAEVVCGAARAASDRDGRASVTVPADGCTLVVTAEGLAPLTLAIRAEAAPLEITLEEALEMEEEVVVSATRSGRLASDQALRVEVVNREEIEEKLLMTPGDIVMLLNETSGIRLQATSPALGAAAVRVQGLTGRYTPVLTDGLPINSTQVASLGLLQIPPMDLRQVEVIKGAASALYGASALGGVINLVTRHPAKSPEHEALFNVTSREGADALLWSSGPAGGRAGYTFLGGAHSQNASDIDDDGWFDLPRYRRIIGRPKLSLAFDQGGLDLIGGLTYEVRTGGFVNGGVQAVDTTRVDVGGAFRRIIGGTVLVARGAWSTTRHEHVLFEDIYDDRHDAQFGEVSFARGFGAHTVVVGAAFDRQAYGNVPYDGLEYAWTTPAVFAQDDWTVRSWWTLSLSGRIDWHSEYGTFASPRVSSLFRAREWSIRASVGGGFFAPTALTEEADEVGLGRVDPLQDIVAERGTTYSIDVSRPVGFADLSVTFFGSRISDALAADTSGERLTYYNRPAASNGSGVEFFARLRRGPLVATASYAWTRVTEVERDGARLDVPLTPRQAWGIVGAWEKHGVARVGLELYRTGTQRLEDNPYRSESPAYTIFGMLAERRFGRLRLFINLENLTDVRQTRTDPLLRPTPSSLGRHTVDAWAPLDGRTINGGVRIAF